MDNQIVKAEITDLADFLNQPEIIKQFTDLLGDQGKSYVQSVIIAATDSPDLMNCTPRSIFRSALRAAALELSCDPAKREAYLIPRNKKIKEVRDPKTNAIVIPEHWEKRAEFQPHYHGLYNLAMRSNKYWVINVSPVYEGSEVYEDTLTGLHSVQLENGLMTAAGEPVSRLRKVSDKIGKKVIGWIGYYKTVRGAEKTVYMSIKEIEAHAAKFSDSYTNASSMWNKNSKHRQTMEMKTVLIALMKWSDTKGPGAEKIRAAMESITSEEDTDQDTDIEAEFMQEEPQDLGSTENEITPEEDEYNRACEAKTPKGLRLRDCTDEQLHFVEQQTKDIPLAKLAAIVSNWRRDHWRESKP